MAGVLIREKCVHRERRRTQRKPCFLETEIEVLYLQAKENQGLPVKHQKLRRSKERFSSTSFRKLGPANTLSSYF